MSEYNNMHTIKTIQVGDKKHILMSGSHLDEFGYTFAVVDGDNIEIVRKDMFNKTERVYTSVKELKELLMEVKQWK